MTTKSFTPVEDLQGVERIVAMTILNEVEPGTDIVIAEALRALAGRLENGDTLQQREVTFLANSLRRVASDVRQFGEPFGYVPREGRHGLNSLHRLALGKRVDELHNPKRYSIDASALPLSDNTKKAGAYTTAAEEMGLSKSTAERAYRAYRKYLQARKIRLKTT